MPPLQHRPKRLHAVGVRIAVDEFTPAMRDALVFKAAACEASVNRGIVRVGHAAG